MFDPLSIWMQSTVFWVKVFKQQHDAYLRMLGTFAQKIPHHSAADLARAAEAGKTKLALLTPKAAAVTQPTVKKDLVNA